MKLLQTVSLLAATMTAGLMAGLFAAFAYSVMPGLHRLGDQAFVAAMQRINVAILNGWFGICFGGALVFTVAAAGLHLSGDARSALPWILAGLALYVLTLAITFAVNVPLNNRLAAAGPPERIGDPTAARAVFEASWVRWNIVRALTATTAFGCLAWALLLHGRAA